MELTFLLLALSIITLLIMYKLNRPKDTNGIPIPGPKGWPIIGSALDINALNLVQTMRTYTRKYGSVFSIKMFHIDIVCLNSADAIRKAYGENPYQTMMSNRGPVFVAERFFDNGANVSFVVEGHGALHKELRKRYAKALHAYGDGIQEFEDKLQSELTRFMNVIDDFNSEAFEFEAILKRSLSNLISFLLSGKAIEDEYADIFWKADEGIDYLLNPVRNIILLTFPFLVNIPGRLKTLYSETAKAREKIKRTYVDSQRETYEPGKIRGFVDSLIAQRMADEEGGGAITYTDERIMSTTLETIAAGILTTLSTLTNLMLCLLHHPEYQQKIQQELDPVVGRDRRPKLSDRAKCPITEAVIIESMRYITPSPFLLPHLSSENFKFEGYDMKKDSMILANVDAVHHDENVWKDPWTFRPERFLDDQGQLLPRSHVVMKSWLPFGLGRRQCPGESLARNRIFLYLTSLLQRYGFEPVVGHLGPCDTRQNEHFDTNITVRPKPFLCRAVKRSA